MSPFGAATVMNRHRQAWPPQNKAVFSGQFELLGDFQLPERPLTSTGVAYDEARLLVRIAGEPIGFVTLPLGESSLTRQAVMGAIGRQLRARAELQLDGSGLPVELLEQDAGVPVPARGPVELLTPAPSLAVVVCTRNRAHALDGCLSALRQVRYERIEFILVDNAPADESTHEAVMRIAAGDSRFRYVRERAPGLSRARNCGLRHAQAELIAYTDDDVRVDPLWANGLARGFARDPRVGCVTGLVASASLELATEQYFDARVWWSSSCEPRLYEANRRPADIALYPYTAGAFGTGANFAFRTQLLRAVGGFDECLGAGSPCAGGEDLDIFVRIVRAGNAICYEPAALVWHDHRADLEELRRQMYAYGKALSAYVFKYASSRRTALDVLAKLAPGVRHLWRLARRANRAGEGAGLDRGMMLAELRGLLVGPLAYVRARHAQDPEHRRAVAP